MLTDEVFLQAIRADPRDEAPWLIYADWLEERGDPRAALYRRQRFSNALGMTFVLVPPGSFFMGDRGEQRLVEMPHEFYIGAYPITQEQWQTVMGNNPSFFSRSGIGANKVNDFSEADVKLFPVEWVSWDDVQEFLKRFNEREQNSGFLYRLPSETEWEYSCRGGATSQHDCNFDFYFAEPTNDLTSEQANFNGYYPAGSAPQGKYLERTTKVGSYKPNRLGLYDMHGNVWEWCLDLLPDSARVFCGGSWFNYGMYCRASHRNYYGPSFRSYFVGFRLVAASSGK